MTTKLNELHTLGQSMWYDNIARDLLESGSIKALIDQGIRGLTSNPAIFQKAITSGTAYDQQLSALKGQPLDAKTVYEALAIRDIQAAADLLRGVYDESKGVDGYVSLEVAPTLANDTPGTIDEAARLWGEVNRPNLMIKIPATEAGIPAIIETIANGINVNVTLIFSRVMYGKVMDAYLAGLERRAEAGHSVDVASVASFFVSRVDSMIDDMLGDGKDELKGQAGIANAKLAYQDFKAVFTGARWEALKEKGARVQRPLWASTSTKDPAYPDTMYVDTLIGAHTVNTAPPHTIDAFIDHGVVAQTVEDGVDEANALVEKLAGVGIEMEDVTAKLLEEGVAKFMKPFDVLLDAITAKQDELSANPGD